MRISKESLAIFTIGTADLASTLFWVHYGGAQEANPLFARYLAMGTGWFILTKFIMLAGPVFLLEWARNHRPQTAILGARFAMVAYLCMYGVGVIRLNSPDVSPRGAATLAALSPPGELQMRKATARARMFDQNARRFWKSPPQLSTASL
jgi:hypothetical protein